LHVAGDQQGEQHGDRGNRRHLQEARSASAHPRATGVGSGIALRVVPAAARRQCVACRHLYAIRALRRAALRRGAARCGTGRLHPEGRFAVLVAAAVRHYQAPACTLPPRMDLRARTPWQPQWQGPGLAAPIEQRLCKDGSAAPVCGTIRGIAGKKSFSTSRFLEHA